MIYLCVNLWVAGFIRFCSNQHWRFVFCWHGLVTTKTAWFRSVGCILSTERTVIWTQKEETP